MRRARKSVSARLIFAIPVLGWMLRDVAEGDESAMGWFALTLACLIAIATLSFGLPGLVMAMLGAAAFTLATILFVTFG